MFKFVLIKRCFTLPFAKIYNDEILQNIYMDNSCINHL